MSGMESALGVAQLEPIQGLVPRKRRIFPWYQEEFAGIEGLTLNYEAPGVKNT